MNISQQLSDAFNEQINKELYSEYIYLAMAAWFEAENWSGFASFFKAQAAEERAHAMKFWHHLYERGSQVSLKAIDAPQLEYAHPKAVFQKAYEHEQFVTKSIHTLMDQALKENDHASKSFLAWFVDEQVEEEDSMRSILEKLERIGDNVNALFMLDAQLGQRQ